MSEPISTPESTPATATESPAAAPPAKPRVLERAVMEWRAAKKTPAWAFAMAKQANGWSVGPETDPTRTTEAQYDAAIAAASHLSIG